jgi:hypothetical protein
VIRVQAAAAAASRESAVCRTFARSLALGSYEFMHRAQHPRASPGEFTGVLLFIGILRLNLQNCCVRASHHRTRTQGAFNSAGSAAMDTKPTERCCFLAFPGDFSDFPYSLCVSQRLASCSPCDIQIECDCYPLLSFQTLFRHVSGHFTKLPCAEQILFEVCIHGTIYIFSFPRSSGMLGHKKLSKVYTPFHYLLVVLELKYRLYVLK